MDKNRASKIESLAKSYLKAKKDAEVYKKQLENELGRLQSFEYGSIEINRKKVSSSRFNKDLFIDKFGEEAYDDVTKESIQTRLYVKDVS